MRYGPFPMRVGRLLAGAALIAVGVPVIALTWSSDRVQCMPTTGICRVERPLEAPLDFRQSDFLSIRIARSLGAKNHPVARPILVLGGGEIPLRTVEPSTADEFARIAEGALRGTGPVVLSLHDSWWLPVFFGLMPLMGVGLLVTALRGIGRYRLEHDGARRELTVTRTVFSVPISQRTISTNGVVDVEIEWARDKDFFHQRYQVGDTIARLVLVTTDGEGRPLCAGMHRGYTLHRRGRDELAALLGCPPPGPAIAARREADALTFHPPPGSFRGWNRLAAAWIGLCCGSLLGMAAYALGGIALGVLHGRDPVDEYALVFGAGGGAVAGVALAFYLTRPREPR